MFGHSKSITIFSNISTLPLTYIMLFVFGCVMAYNGRWLYAILSLVVIVVIRIFTGKLKLKDGDMIYVFGLPGSGKTMLLAKIADDNKSKRNICVNKELDHLTIDHTVINKELLSKYRFGCKDRGAAILYDEVSLDGFDNRDFKTNFSGEKGQELLEAFKKCRHRYTAFVLANQGYDEVDKKIRSGLCKCAYWVINKGAYSVAVRLDKGIKINELTGEPQDVYLKPNLIKRIIKPSCYIYINHKKYGKLYQTINDDTEYYFKKAE